MKTVKIINGAYGQRVGGKTRLVRLGETCQVDDQEAARLVGLKVAAYVEKEPEAAPPVPPMEDSGKMDSGKAEKEPAAEKDPPKKPQKPKKPGKGKSEDEQPPDLSPEDPVV